MAPEIRPLPKYHDPVTSLSITGSSSTIVRSPTLDSPTTGGSSRTGDSPRTVDGPQMADSPRTVGSVMIESDVYGMAIVIYEVRPYQSTSFSLRDESHIRFLDFDGDSAALGVSR